MFKCTSAWLEFPYLDTDRVSCKVIIDKGDKIRGYHSNILALLTQSKYRSNALMRYVFSVMLFRWHQCWFLASPWQYLWSSRWHLHAALLWSALARGLVVLIPMIRQLFSSQSISCKWLWLNLILSYIKGHGPADVIWIRAEKYCDSQWWLFSSMITMVTFFFLFDEFFSISSYKSTPNRNSLCSFEHNNNNT